MADDPTKPSEDSPTIEEAAAARAAEAAADPEAARQSTPPLAAGDKPASEASAEPLKGEVSRTDAPGAGASAAPVTVPADGATPSAGKPAPPPVAKPAAPAAAKPAAPAAAKAAAPAAKPPAAAEHAPKASAPTGPTEPPPPAGLAQPAFIASLQAAIPGSVTNVIYWVGDWTILVPAELLLDVARHMRQSPDAAFDFCSDVTATDWPPRAERFDLIYCLYSTRHRHRVRVKTRVAELQPVASVTPVWPSANWLEREVFDMFGVNFSGHPDRRRILMPDDWQGHPQRKDYPLEGPGELLMENPLDWLRLKQAKEESDIE